MEYLQGAGLGWRLRGREMHVIGAACGTLKVYCLHPVLPHCLLGARYTDAFVRLASREKGLGLKFSIRERETSPIRPAFLIGSTLMLTVQMRIMPISA